MPDIEPAVPAQPAAETISATRAAANSGDLTAFLEADTSARAGKPLAPVAVAKPADAAVVEAPAESRAVSKRQQDTNDRIREAVERATAETRAELARLRAEFTPKPAPAPADTPTTVAEWKRIHALPDAPKLTDFDTVEEHSAAMAYFVHQTLNTERATADRQRQSRDADLTALATEGQSYGERMQKAAQADPDLKTKIAPELHDAYPISAYPVDPRSGQRVDPRTGQPVALTFKNAIAEVGLRSESPAALYVYLSEHKDEAKRISSLHPDRAMEALQRLDGRLSAGSPPAPQRSASPAPSTITAAPPPPPSVSSQAGSSVDPQATALARGDFAAFDQLEMDKERKRRGLSA